MRYLYSRVTSSIALKSHETKTEQYQANAADVDAKSARICHRLNIFVLYFIETQKKKKTN